MPGEVEGVQELIESLLVDAEVGRDVEAIRNAVDPETFDEAVAELIHDIAPAIRSQERQRVEKERCENCHDTGIYTEGLEWAPCDECFRGKEFATLLRAHAKEVRQQERQRVRATFEKRIAYLRSEAKSGRELADQSVDPEDARKYRIRAGSYEWAADGFEHDLAALDTHPDADADVPYLRQLARAALQGSPSDTEGGEG